MKTQKQNLAGWCENMMVQGVNGDVVAITPGSRPRDLEQFLVQGAYAAKFLKWPRWSSSVLPRNESGTVCPVLDTFMSTWHDGTREDDRGRLFGAPVLSMAKEARMRFGDVSNRWWMIADWMCRTALPVVLEHNGLAQSAEALRALSPIAEVFSDAQWQAITTALDAMAALEKGATGVGWRRFYNVSTDEWDKFRWPEAGHPYTAYDVGICFLIAFPLPEEAIVALQDSAMQLFASMCAVGKSGLS